MTNPGALIDRLRGILDEAADAAVWCWSREEIAEWVCALQPLRAQLDGVCCEAARVAAAQSVQVLGDRTRTLAQFVTSQSVSCGVDIAIDVKIAAWLSTLPVFADAWRHGAITRRHVAHLRDLDRPRCHRRLQEAQGALVLAASSGWDGFVEACRFWQANADPDGELPKEQARRRGASLRVRSDGTVTGTFTLDTVTGAAVTAALNAETMRLLRLDADPCDPDAAPRTPRQAMADALAALLTRGAERPHATAGTPLLHVVVGDEVLSEAICRVVAAREGVLPFGPDGALLPDDLGIDPSIPTRRCQLVDGTFVHPNVVVGLLGVATLKRLVLGAESEILDLGRDVRLFPRHLRAAILAAGRGRCSATRCAAPLAWLEADHVIPWSRGGPTSTANAQVLCGACNKAKRDSVEPRDPAKECRAT